MSRLSGPPVARHRLSPIQFLHLAVRRGLLSCSVCRWLLHFVRPFH